MMNNIKKSSALVRYWLIGLTFLTLMSGCASSRNSQIRPDLSIQHFITGQALMEQAKFGEALKALKRADSFQPDTPAILFSISQANFNLGNERAAIKYLNKAIQYDPENVDYLNRAGEFYLTQNKTAKAKDMFEKVLYLDVNNYEAHYGLGIVAIDTSDYKEAEKNFRRLIAFEPEDVESYFYLGNVLVLDKQLDEAIKVFLDALELREDNVRIRYYLGMLYQKKKDFVNAEQQLFLIIEDYPDFAPAYEMLASVYFDQEKYSISENYYKKTLELAPNTPTVKNNLAWLYLKQNIELDKALKLAQESVANMPMADNLDTLGWAYFVQGEDKEADKYLKLAWKAAQKHGDNQTLSIIRYHQAHLLMKLGKTSKALKYMREAVELDPENEDAQTFLKSWQNKTEKS